MQATFQHYLQLDAPTVNSLLSLELEDFLALPAVTELLGSLNAELLRETLPTAGQILAKQLPPFYDWLKQELGVNRVPDSPGHATKWVVAFLNNQESLTHLVELHRPIPEKALQRSIPRLVSAFDGVEEDTVRFEWQKTVAALCLVLVVGAHETASVVQPVAG